MTQIEIINNELIKRGISQKDFCDSIGIFPSTFSTWKSRNTRIPSKYIVPISNYFEWPSQKLIECELPDDTLPECSINNNLTNSSITSTNMVINRSNGIESEFFDLFNGLSLSAKAKVISYATELSEGENAE